jgi:hypothetical protein
VLEEASASQNVTAEIAAPIASISASRVRAAAFARGP